MEIVAVIRETWVPCNPCQACGKVPVNDSATGTYTQVVGLATNLEEARRLAEQDRKSYPEGAVIEEQEGAFPGIRGALPGLYYKDTDTSVQWTTESFELQGAR